MNTTYVIALAFIAFFAAGCASSSRMGASTPIVKPGLVLVPADQARYYGIGASRGDEVDRAPTGLDARSVDREPEITALQFNRYPDPARPDELMHEAHIVYRREGAPRWRLQPASADQQILVGPQLSDGRGEVKPLASQELDAFLQEERGQRVREQEAMAKLADRLRALGEEQQRLHEEIRQLRQLPSSPLHDPAPTASPLQPSKAPAPASEADESER